MSFSPAEKSADATIEMTEMTRQSTPSSGEAGPPTPSTSSTENGDKALEALGYTPVSFETRAPFPSNDRGLRLTYSRYSSGSSHNGRASALL